MPAMVVNDDTGCLNERGAFGFIASKLAPTRDCVIPVPPVGAGLPAMVVNDDAGCVNEHGAFEFIALTHHPKYHPQASP